MFTSLHVKTVEKEKSNSLNSTCIMLDHSGQIYNVYSWHKFKDYEDWIMEEQIIDKEKAVLKARFLASQRKGKYLGEMETVEE